MSFTVDLDMLGEDEVSQRLRNGRLGSPDSENYKLVQEWLRGKDREREDALNARPLSYSAF